MAARVSTIWFVDNSDTRDAVAGYLDPDRDAALTLAAALYPEMEFETLGLHPLSVAATAAPGFVFIGSYPGVRVLCSSELNIARPSELHDGWFSVPQALVTMLISSIPETGHGTFARWEDGKLRRSFSASPVDITENIGIPQRWELPFWAGEHPLRYPPGMLPDPQALPFHPQQFAEAANLDWLNFRYTGQPQRQEFDSNRIMLWGFKIHPIGTAPRPAPPPEPVKLLQESHPRDNDEMKPRGRLARLFGLR